MPTWHMNHMFAVCTSMVEGNMLVRHYMAFPITAQAMISWIAHGALSQLKIIDVSFFFCMSYVRKSGGILVLFHAVPCVFSCKKHVRASCLDCHMSSQNAPINKKKHLNPHSSIIQSEHVLSKSKKGCFDSI